MTAPQQDRAVEAVASVLHDLGCISTLLGQPCTSPPCNRHETDGNHLEAGAVLAFIRDAIHREGADADAIRETLGFTRDTGYGHLTCGILVHTYDGTAKEHQRWRLLTEWQEAQP